MQVYVWLIYYAIQQETNNIVSATILKKKDTQGFEVVCVCMWERGQGDKIDPRKCKIREFLSIRMIYKKIMNKYGKSSVWVKLGDKRGNKLVFFLMISLSIYLPN